MDPEHYYRELAIAYVRGACPDLAGADDEEVLAAAPARELRLHRFKRTAGLPRVRRVIGTLKGFAPESVLDLGSGRGVFLWPLLDELPEAAVTAVDLLEHRVEDIDRVRRGGVARLTAECLDAARLPWAVGAFDAVTVLEVLEHVDDPAPVAAEAVRVARSVVVATVPSKPDDNPGHVRLFTGDTLGALLRDAGAARVHIEHVPNHIVAVAAP